ncbi:MAG: hypothetical protein DMG63_11915 [Acidobacteria bacterium]|nr:MAG: hypothetical protein DMG63_11915 [Acidobacteriota bacterium]
MSVKLDQAILLDDTADSLPYQRIAKLLSFFGVSWRRLTLSQFIADAAAKLVVPEKCRIFSSAGTFLRLLEACNHRPESMPHSHQNIHSAFVFADGDPQVLEKLVQLLAGDERAELRHIHSGGEEFVVANDTEFCGVMASLRVPVSSPNDDVCLVSNIADTGALSLISSASGSIFLKLQCGDLPAFVSTSAEIIDIDGKLTTQNFDVRGQFLSAVPVVLYIKWAFAETCWNAPEANACLVIDDPVLKSTHGFVDFQQLLSLMKRHNFSTNVAFIPWNWRRSAPEVVQLFRENPARYSLSVHGCDHTRAEFGSSDRQRLYWKTQQAIERMTQHESITGISHDRVMVFPQGIFSEAAMDVLRRTGLIASVNNDVISADPHPRAITVSDVWDIAVMRYSFPLFTRRYPWEGIENFAFDVLLGKPAIAVIHHDYCSDHCARLVNFIQRLNALHRAPTWRNLGEVVRRSCRQREVSPGAVEVEMYGTELRIENRSEQPKHFLIKRRDHEASAIQRICAGAHEISWKPVNGHIELEIELNPGENQVIQIRFYDAAEKRRSGDNLPYRLKAMLRRYLCEVRDNYIVPMRFRFTAYR